MGCLLCASTGQTDRETDGHRAFTYRRSLQEVGSFDNRLFSESSPVVITLREIIFGNLLIVFFLFFLCLFCAARRQLELKRSKSSRKTRAARYIASCARIKVEWTHTRAHTHTRLTALRPGLPRLASTRGTRSSAIAEGPRDASCQLKSCQLPHKSAGTTCSTSPEP